MDTKSILKITVGDLDNFREINSESKRRFVSASPNISIQEALSLMAKNDILCLPIQSHNDPNNVVNLVNLFDILSFITSELPENPTLKEPTSSGVEGNIKRRRSLDSSQILHPDCYRRLNNSIESVMTLDSERESYRLCSCSVYDNITGVLVHFGKGVHRAVVTDEKGTPFRVITQMDILRHLVKHPELFPKDLVEKSVQSLGLLSINGVTFVKENSLAIDAYRVMAGNRYTSVVVIDNTDGKIVSNLSASSLRGLASSNLDHLILPVSEFMKKSPRGQRPLLYCSSEITLWELIQLLVSKNVHHAWFVDEKQKPYASVSPTDILKILKGELN